MSERIRITRFKPKIRNVAVIQCYASSEVNELNTKEEFYQQLKGTLEKVPKRDVKFLMDDMKNKVGQNNEGLQQVRRIHGLREMNKNGEMFSNFCATHDLVTGGTIFRHKKFHKMSWVSPDHTTVNQIHHIAVDRKFILL
jgi:hypothetical protein